MNLVLFSISIKKTWLAIAMPVLIVLMATINIKAEEMPQPLREIGLCDISSNYAIIAFNEKLLTKDDLVDGAETAFSTMLYGLSRDESFNKMSMAEQRSFIGFVSDVYQYVFFTKDLNKDNVESKTMEHCKGMVHAAWGEINQKAIYCQQRGLLFEKVAEFKENNYSKIFTLRFLTSELKKGSSAMIYVSNAVNKVFNANDSLSPSVQGEMEYKKCLKSK